MSRRAGLPHVEARAVLLRRALVYGPAPYSVDSRCSMMATNSAASHRPVQNPSFTRLARSRIGSVSLTEALPLAARRSAALEAEA